MLLLNLLLYLFFLIFQNDSVASHELMIAWLLIKKDDILASCRVKLAGAVQDMVISEVCGRQFLFVLHSDGVLRVWDLSCHSRVLNHSMNIATLAGTFY